MRDVTICFTYFRSLTLENLDAALYSVSKQDMERVADIVIVDNNTSDPIESIEEVITRHEFGVPARLLSFKHFDSSKTHAWSTNVAAAEVRTPFIFFCRADYLLEFDALRTMLEAVESGFATGRVFHLQVPIDVCEGRAWRESGPSCLRPLGGVEETYMEIDSGVWLTTKEAFDSVGGLDERLTAWGHAQTFFQYNLFLKGVRFTALPKVLFYHPWHSGPRDIGLAHQQLENLGYNARQLWERHKGYNPYA